MARKRTAEGTPYTTEQLHRIFDHTVSPEVFEAIKSLDPPLRQEAEDEGLTFHRVPVPQDSDALSELFADLILSRAGLIGTAADPVEWRQCVCRGGNGLARCTNGLRLSSHIPLDGQR